MEMSRRRWAKCITLEKNWDERIFVYQKSCEQMILLRENKRRGAPR